MLRRKTVLLTTLYIGLVVGLPALLVLVVSQSFPIFGADPASGWQLRSYRLTVQPGGRYLLPFPSAFVVHQGSITLITYPLSELTGVQSQLLSEGKTYGMMTNRRSSIFNQQSSAVELILTQAIEPGAATQPTPTPQPIFSKGFNVNLLEQHFVTILPSREELEQIAVGYRQRLAKFST